MQIHPGEAIAMAASEMAVAPQITQCIVISTVLLLSQMVYLHIICMKHRQTFVCYLRMHPLHVFVYYSRIICAGIICILFARQLTFAQIHICQSLEAAQGWKKYKRNKLEGRTKLGNLGTFNRSIILTHKQ